MVQPLDLTICFNKIDLAKHEGVGQESVGFESEAEPGLTLTSAIYRLYDLEQVA